MINGWSSELNKISNAFDSLTEPEQAKLFETDYELADEDLEKLIEEYESGRYGEYWTKDEKYCIFCEETGTHTIDDCPELDICSKCGTDEHDTEDCIEDFDDGWDDPLSEFVIDEFDNIIPKDPYTACFDVLTGELYECKCKPKKDYACITCDVGREWPSHAWRPYRKDGEYNLAKRKNRRKGKGLPQRPKNQNTKTNPTYESFDKKTPTGPNKWDSAWDNDWFWGATDRHYGDTYTTYDGSITFHVSSSWNLRKEGEYVPQFGLYFDWGWKPWWRAEHIDWPDMSLPTKLEVAFEQILAATELALTGVDVEFGCIGAHGRTGTALAVVNVILGCEAQEAISHVRNNHCKHAIETPRQEWYVHWVHNQLYGSELPAMPTSAYGSYGGYSANSTYKSSGVVSSALTNPYTKTGPKIQTKYGGEGSCSLSGHFSMWLDIEPGTPANFCPNAGRNCQWWTKDVKKFMEGEFPPYGVSPTPLAPVFANSTAVDGYIVPKPGYKETKHNAEAKKGCYCDVCRYQRLGHGAFLRPAEQSQGKAWDAVMTGVEKQAFANLGMARVKAHLEAEKNITLVNDYEDEEWIKVAQHDGTVLDIRIAKEFKHRPPKDPPPNHKHGFRKGEFVYIENEGWVWEGLGKMPV